MKRIGCTVALVVGLVACSGGGHHSVNPPPTNATSATGTATKTVEVHGTTALVNITGVHPMPQTRIEAKNLQGRAVGIATTNAKGVFVLRLLPGEYNFTIRGGAGIAAFGCPTRATVRRTPRGSEVDVRCNGD